MGIKRKACFLFAFLSFFSNFGFAEVTMHSAMKRKTSFSFALHSFFSNFADKSTNLLPLGKTKKNLVFRSLNRNFAANYR